jgi:hypothetical protein
VTRKRPTAHSTSVTFSSILSAIMERLRHVIERQTSDGG